MGKLRLPGEAYDCSIQGLAASRAILGILPGFRAGISGRHFGPAFRDRLRGGFWGLRDDRRAVELPGRLRLQKLAACRRIGGPGQGGPAYPSKDCKGLQTVIAAGDLG